MRNSRVRFAFLGLILVLPILMQAMSVPSRNPSLAGSGGGWAVLWVEMVVVAGLIFAVRERRRLLMERTAPRTVAPVARHAPMGRLSPVAVVASSPRRAAVELLGR